MDLISLLLSCMLIFGVAYGIANNKISYIISSVGLLVVLMNLNIYLSTLEPKTEIKESYISNYVEIESRTSIIKLNEPFEITYKIRNYPWTIMRDKKIIEIKPYVNYPSLK